MDLNRLTREADEQIRKVVARYNQLYVPSGTVSQLELDLLLDELRKLYDTFKTIGHINQARLQHIQKPAVTVHSPSVAEMQAGLAQAAASRPNISTLSEPGTTQAQPQPAPKHEPEVQDEITKEITETVETEHFVHSEPAAATKEEEQPGIATENRPEETAIHADAEKTVSHNQTEQAPAMLADRFNPGNKSLSETMASAPANEAMGSRMLFHPITDLSAGIGLNDKFSFISDLFGNNAGQYEEAITRINKAVNLDEANWIFQKYHTPDWNQKQEALARMKSFIKRRFI